MYAVLLELGCGEHDNESLVSRSSEMEVAGITYQYEGRIGGWQRSIVTSYLLTQPVALMSVTSEDSSC